MRFLLFTSLCVIGFDSDAFSQVRVQATLIADTQQRVFAGSASRSVPRGTDLSTGLDLLATDGSGTGGARHQVYFEHSPLTGTNLALSDLTNIETLGVAVGTGPHQKLLTLTPTNGATIPAELFLSYGAFATLGAAHVGSRGRIDVGDDGAFELDGTLGATVERTLRVTIPPAGLRIRTITSSVAQQPGQPQRVTHHGNLQIRVRPVTGCTLTNAGGGSCVALSPLMFPAMTFANSLSLETSNAPPNVAVITVFGTRLVRTPIPGTPCLLNVFPEVFLFGQTDAAGSAHLELPVPPNLAFTLHAQQVTQGFNPFVPWLPTSAVTIQCR